MAINAGLQVSTVGIIVNGNDIAQEQARRLTEVIVEQSLHVPDMFVMRFEDAGDDSNPRQAAFFRILDQNSFSVGAEVEIDMGYGNDRASLIKGEITAVELNVDPDGPPILTVRGYARSHRLHRGRQSQSYQNVTDADIATKIAQQVGLLAETDSTSQVHDYVLQHNQTNWEFLKQRADRIGYELFVDDRTLHFRKPRNGQDLGPEPRIWENLESLRVSLTTAFQASTVVVRGWDPTTKKAIVGTATRGEIAPETGIPETGAQLASAFGDASVYVVDCPIADQAEANALAQAVYNDLDGTLIQAEGVCDGDPTIRPGITLDMTTIGKRLSGKYYVTSATHRISTDDAYKTSFVVSGRQTNSLLDLTDRRGEGPRLPSAVIGIVTDNTDPDGNLGRVKVKFPWLTDDDQSWWARIASPMAGQERGFYFLPEIDDEVLVTFEHGDINRPYILGALWNGQDQPPKKNSDVIASSKVNERMIKTRSGHVISLDDTDGAEKISITDKTGNNKIVIDSKNNTIAVQADGDISITSSKGKVAVSAQQDVTIDTKGNAVVKATGNVDVQAQGNASVKATGNGSLNATGSLDLKGSSVMMQATGTMTIKASGPLTIQGAIVNINP